MSERTLSDPEIQARNEKLYTTVIDAINQQLVPDHLRGDLTAGELVYIVCNVLSKAIAIVMFGQTPTTNNPELQERLIEGFCQKFRRDVEQLMEMRHNGVQITEMPPDSSHWD
jgi:hypothetical protein